MWVTAAQQKVCFTLAQKIRPFYTPRCVIDNIMSVYVTCPKIRYVALTSGVLKQ
jgi:hypothetical protein